MSGEHRDEGWLSEAFEAPPRLELSTGEHLRQIRASDIDVDFPTVMANQPFLWATFGAVWGWPPADMTRQQDLDDLMRHVEEMERNESFNYAIFDAEETTLRGCVYIDPPEKAGADAELSWWVVEEDRGGPLEDAVRVEVPRWIEREWPFTSPRCIGVDLTWDEWAALPDA
jgi:hypothetical protein